MALQICFIRDIHEIFLIRRCSRLPPLPIGKCRSKKCLAFHSDCPFLTALLKSPFHHFQLLLNNRPSHQIRCVFRSLSPSRFCFPRKWKMTSLTSFVTAARCTYCSCCRVPGNECCRDEPKPPLLPMSADAIYAECHPMVTRFW